MTTCSEKSCKNNVHARGLCNTHYRYKLRKKNIKNINHKTITVSPKEKLKAMISVDKISGCWNWLGGRASNNGYGRMYHRGVNKLAHRWSWEIYNGEIPQNLCVLHRCDNPRCVNPDHLFLGTQHNNMADMVKKGRQRGPAGETHHKAKLTEEEVKKIRSSPLSIKQLANEYSVCKSTIEKILLRKNWKNV